MIDRVKFLLLVLASLLLIGACNKSEPPTLMKANTPFATDEERDHHIAHMRTHHMHALKHKRDETMYQGIRTEDHSLKACINCHVPESYNGKVLRHTDPEHFCSTCHNYVAEKLNCFECHVDHPVKETESLESPQAASKNALVTSQSNTPSVKNLSKLSRQELIDLAFTYSKSKEMESKTLKSGGVSFKDPEVKVKVNSDSDSDSDSTTHSNDTSAKSEVESE